MNKHTKEKYDKLFPDEKSKAAAFDKLAEHFYHQNFSTMTKAEIDLLMFSEYLERIYALEGDDESQSSDYALSKVLGITQSRVSSLKERKELKYPSKFVWREEFRKVLHKAEYINGKVQIYINDHRLYMELCNVVKELGSYSETTLTKQLLVVSLPAFVDLMVECEENEQTKERMREKLCEILRANEVDAEKYLAKKETFKSALKNKGSKIVADIAVEAVKAIPVAGSVLGTAAESVIDAILESRNKA